MLGPILAPSWGPTWLHFGPQDPPKSHQDPIPRGIQIQIDFRLDFASILVPSWPPTWPQLGAQKRPRSDPRGAWEASWKHLGPRTRPRPARTPSRPPPDPLQTLSGPPPEPDFCSFNIKHTSKTILRGDKSMQGRGRGPQGTPGIPTEILQKI